MFFLKKIIILGLVICLIAPIYFAHETEEPHEEPIQEYTQETFAGSSAIDWITKNPVETIIYAIILIAGIALLILLILPRFVKIKPKQ